MKRIYNLHRTIQALLLLFPLLLVNSCKDGFEDKTFTAYDEFPISVYLNQHPDQFSRWVEVLKQADLYNTLNLNANYTHFVPVNEGVDRYLKAKGYTSVQDMSKEDAAYLVRYHLIAGTVIDLGQFQSGAIDELNETDDNLSIEFRGGGLEAVYLNGLSRFKKFDVKATNGIIHIIEDVLIPLTETITDRLQQEKFSIFYEAVKMAGYEERLKTVYTPSTDEQGNPIEIRYRYTAFAVANQTFAADNIRSITDLITKLSANNGLPYTDVRNPLNQYVAYHLLGQLRDYASLGQFPSGQRKMNINTLADKQLIKMSEGQGELLLNSNAANTTGIKFVEFNVLCKNGVLHEVNNWMPVFTPERVSVIWELSDYPDVEANVTQFKKANLSAQYNKTFVTGDLKSIIWSARPETRSNVLIYRNSRPADGIYYSDVLNYDHLRVTLGESGWIEMNSPVIVKGKYKVTFFWPSPIQATSTGICSFILDGVLMRDKHTISNTRTDRQLEQSLGNVTFEETTSHKLRILSLDGKLITLDYIRFDPID
ncbi:fasciclin domain-containing protein [Sphingobacterium spiritivorum]|uniref:Fasciclin domain protein n=1 Tax=Sphingobacterium spiritivorum ATCC 33861 TaxID=525373 RepID=D7VJL2_SPHSI|nr:fasciclin domain-containing protein [Sphingobacterium spiritivorum]EFK59065.1 fasciclin domain protein [Sphingobacterium spiritivorum ATCC 33861]QQT36924.1 fasciclin domain-containing protein [Sphingobacterium spiritivorum]WQD33685.1 fasciclin domain-containing protein [Sphingobacterium spiritivorum]SUJ25922.1 Fasciclin domain [Sphingobacterium spiritivorum]